MKSTKCIFNQGNRQNKRTDQQIYTYIFEHTEKKEERTDSRSNILVPFHGIRLTVNWFLLRLF